MEGHRRLLCDLDTEQLFSRLLSEDKLIAKSAKYLHENDIDGACFVEMEDEEFDVINGLSFGIKKALIRFRKKVLQEEQESSDKPILDNGPGSAPVPVDNKEEETKGIAGAAVEQEFESKINITEWTPGQCQVVGEDSTDLFGQPTPVHTEIDGEGVVEDSFSLPSATIPKESSQIESSCSIDCRLSKAVEKSKEAAPSARVQYTESFPSSKSLTLSNKSLVKQRKLPNFELNSIVKWQEQGKPRSACEFMKLREEEIVLEGFLQKLAGANSRFKMNHWASRYAIILKSGVFINFDWHREKLFPKGAADLTTIERVQIPLTSSRGSSLRLEIFTTKKRLKLGFSTEAEMLMWRNEMLKIMNRYQGDDEDEKSKKYAFERRRSYSF